MNYWKECISEALDDAGINATEDQIKTIAEWVSGAHENYGMAFGHDCISNSFDEGRLKEELRKEKSKVYCKSCKGQGYIVTNGPYHSSETTCHVCRGEVRHL